MAHVGGYGTGIKVQILQDRPCVLTRRVADVAALRIGNGDGGRRDALQRMAENRVAIWAQAFVESKVQLIRRKCMER